MNDIEFGYRIRQALDEGAQRVDYATAMRLEKARFAALARHQGAAAGRRTPAATEFGWGWIRAASLVVPVLALLIGFVSIYEWQHRKHISEMADLDFAVLMDPTPINTYADKSFGVLLRTDDL